MINNNNNLNLNIVTFHKSDKKVVNYRSTSPATAAVLCQSRGENAEHFGV